jgi:lysophospholipase L1-like esterase
MNTEITPWRVTISLLVVGVLCTALTQIVPEEGFQIAGIEFNFYRPFFEPRDTTKQGIADAEAFLEGYDSILEEDSLSDVEKTFDEEKADDELIEERKKLLRIQRGESGIKNLDLFFIRAESAKEKGTRLRVLHYGDSQIEGDRISRNLREKMQQLWGGNGPGMVPPVEVVPSSAIKSSASEGWKRSTIYGQKDKTMLHNRYGVLGSMATYAPEAGKQHRLTFSPSNMAFSRNRQFSNASLYFSVPDSAVTLSVFHNGVEIDKRVLPDSSFFKKISWSLPSSTESLELVFEGGPAECYALALDGGAGIQLDNIGMRGSSGTIFKKIDREQIKKQLTDLNPGLVFLQYGGNTVPYVNDTLAAENYGDWMKSQILFLQGVLPEAAFILIGPSDMAYKDGDEFITYPYLVPVRDALKKTALETGCGFWDIYEAMGGKNSMTAWVAADPPLAAADYVHFSPKGATKVAELLFKALSDEYENYKSRSAQSDTTNTEKKAL